jgi:hypothetical protein
MDYHEGRNLCGFWLWMQFFLGAGKGFFGWS